MLNLFQITCTMSVTATKTVKPQDNTNKADIDRPNPASSINPHKLSVVVPKVQVTKIV